MKTSRPPPKLKSAYANQIGVNLGQLGDALCLFFKEMFFNIPFALINTSDVAEDNASALVLQFNELLGQVRSRFILTVF